MGDAVFATAPGGQAAPAAKAERAPKALAVGFTVLIAAAAVILLGLPQLLRTLPATPAIRIADLQGQVSGAYVGGGGQLYKLYPYPAPAGVFPQGAAVADPTPGIVLKSRTLDEPAMYTLRTYSGAREIAVRRVVLDKHTMRLLPARPLTAGEYFVRASQDGADAGWDYFYFRVGAPQGGVP